MTLDETLSKCVSLCLPTGCAVCSLQGGAETIANPISNQRTALLDSGFFSFVSPMNQLTTKLPSLRISRRRAHGNSCSAFHMFTFEVHVPRPCFELHFCPQHASERGSHSMFHVLSFTFTLNMCQRPSDFRCMFHVSLVCVFTHWYYTYLSLSFSLALC